MSDMHGSHCLRHNSGVALGFIGSIEGASETIKCTAGDTMPSQTFLPMPYRHIRIPGVHIAWPTLLLA